MIARHVAEPHVTQAKINPAANAYHTIVACERKSLMQVTASTLTFIISTQKPDLGRERVLRDDQWGRSMPGASSHLAKC